MTRIIPFISEYFNPYLTIIPILLNPEPKTIKKENEKQTRQILAFTLRLQSAENPLKSQGSGGGGVPGQHSLWRFYWVGALGQSPGFVDSVTLFSRGQTHKECGSGRISDAEEDELLILQGCVKKAGKAPKPSSRRHLQQSLEFWV